MATQEDIRNRKRIRSEFTKRSLDITGMDLQVLHGTVYIRGIIKPVKGASGSVKSEVELIARIIRQQNLAKEVIIDAQLRD
jgi:hypothetical protein